MIPERTREAWERAIYHVFSEQRMTALALLILPLLFIELTVELAPEQFLAIQAADWIIWSVFVAEFASKFYIAKTKWTFLARSPLETGIDLVIILSPLVLLLSPLVGYAPTAPAFRLARELRLERLLKAGAYFLRGAVGLRRLSATFYKHKFYHYVLFACIATLIGSSLIFRLEHGVNPYFLDYWGALWWSLVTVLTVSGLAGAPVTTAGRLIAGALMVIGIGLLAVLTANIAAFFLEQRGEAERGAPLRRRVDSLLRRSEEITKELRGLLEELREEERK